MIPDTYSLCDHDNFGLGEDGPKQPHPFDYVWLLVPAINGHAGAVSFQSTDAGFHYVSIISSEEPGRLGLAIHSKPEANDASFLVYIYTL